MAFTIEQASKAVQSYQPLVVVAVTLSNGTVYRWSTHALNAAEGGAAPVIAGWVHSGQPFAGRCVSHSLGAMQASEQGIDQLSTVQVRVADPDAAIYSAVETSGVGFKGSTLDLFLLYWNAGTSEFSTDVRPLFSGVVLAAASETDITVTARSRVDLARVTVPTVRLSPYCQHRNPVTVEQRGTADSRDSVFWNCGETRDLATAPPCNYTRDTCTQPDRFGGISYEGPRSFVSVSYLQKTTIRGDNAAGQIGDPVPIVYGTAWVTPKVTVVTGEGNSNRFEAILCYGEISGSGDTDSGDVLQVIVNGNEVPFVRYSPDKPLFRWQFVTTGTRDGGPNLDAPLNGQGNPYGGMAAIWVVVHAQISEPGSLPTVRVLMRGPRIRVYADPSTFTEQYTSNPAWVVLDLLAKYSNLSYADCDIASFLAVAAACSASIPYPLPGGGTGNHERFDCSLVIDSAVTLKAAIDGVLSSFRGSLAHVNGKIALRRRSTLADQQPAPVAGSNNLAAIASVSAAGAVTNGYSAYDLDEESIQRDPRTNEIKLFLSTELDQANRVTVRYADRDNRYLLAPYTVTESSDVAAMGQKDESYPALGVSSADQAGRVARARIAERLYGNGAGDNRGTVIAEILTDTRVNHLRPGDIIRVKCAPKLAAFRQFRVESISPAQNWEEARIRARWHDDAWYRDNYRTGAGAAARTPDATHDGPPLAWQPDAAAPVAGNALHAVSDKSFGVVIDYSSTDADGAVIPIATITGKAPVTRTGLLAPVVGLQLGVATSGGSLAGGQRQYWAALVAVDASGNLSPVSLTASTVITTAGTTHKLVLPVILWPADATGYRVYASDDPAYLTLAASGSGTPAAIDITTLAVSASAPPDAKADHIELSVRAVAHAGVWAAAANDVLSGVIEITGAAWTTNEWAGRIVTLLHKADGAAVPIADFTVISNNANQLTVSPDPAGIVAVGDVVTMRAACAIAAQTITDAKWINALSGGAGLAPNEERGRELYIFAGTGAGYGYLIESNTATAITIAGDWRIVPDATSRYVILDSDLGQSISAGVSDNGEPDKTIALRVELRNYAGRVCLFIAHMVSANGRRSIPVLAPRREIYIAGVAGSGGGVGTAPTVTFNAALHEYGKVTVQDCAISGASTLGRLQGVTVTVFYVDELTADVSQSINADVGSGHPLIVGMVPNPNRVTASGVLDFTAGQLCLFAHPGHFELAKITNIAPGVFTFDRLSILGSAIADHPAGTPVLIVQQRTFTFAPAAVDYGASPSAITIADRMDCTIPNACVVAIDVSTTFNGSTGPRTVANTALAAIPGLRTLAGYSYRWQIAGNLAVNQTGIVQRVQYPSNLRVMFARVGTGPTGASVTVVLEKSSDNGGSWSTVSTVAIAAGSFESFDFSTDPPAPRRAPYTGTWPFESAILRPDDLVRPKITGVGSGTAGANLTLEVYV